MIGLKNEEDLICSINYAINVDQRKEFYSFKKLEIPQSRWAKGFCQKLIQVLNRTRKSKLPLFHDFKISSPIMVLDRIILNSRKVTRWPSMLRKIGKNLCRASFNRIVKWLFSDRINSKGFYRCCRDVDWTSDRFSVHRSAEQKFRG